MMHSGDIVRDGARVVVRGNLVFDTVLSVLEMSKTALRTLPRWDISLSQVDHADSAGLALLMHWFREAQRQKKPLKFYAVPVQMQKLINVSGLNSILPISHEAPPPP